MAVAAAATLEAPLALLASRETKQRLDGLGQLEAALDAVELDADTVAHVVAALVPAVGDNNPKMAQGAMQLLQRLGRASGPEFGPLALSAWSALIERMGDSKLPVRTAAAATVVSCMAVRARSGCAAGARGARRATRTSPDAVRRARGAAFAGSRARTPYRTRRSPPLTIVPRARAAHGARRAPRYPSPRARRRRAAQAVGPQLGVDRLRGALEHKNPRAREQALDVLAQALDAYGARQAGVHAMLNHAVRSLEDADAAVREGASALLERMHAHLGEPLVDELQRRALRPAVLKAMVDRIAQLPPVPHAELPAAAAAALLRKKGGAAGAASDEAALLAAQMPPPHAGAHASGGGANGHMAADMRVPPPPPIVRAPSGSTSARAGRAPSPAAGRWARGQPSPRGTARGFGATDGSGQTAGPAGGAADFAEVDVLTPSTDVRPLRVHTERDLTAEMGTIALDLRASTAAEWTTRQAALRRLQALVLGGAPSLNGDATLFLAGLRTLREPLAAQVADLRSQIIREACVTLALLARALGDAFESYVDFFFEKLLRQSVITIAIISSSAHLCLRALIARTRPHRCAPRIAAALADRSSAVRVRAAEYCELLARVLPPPADGERGPLERHADALIGALRVALRDAVADVRALARSAFWALNAHLPAHCSALMAASDVQTQRLLREEEHAAAQRSLELAEAAAANAAAAAAAGGGGGRSASEGAGGMAASPRSARRRLGALGWARSLSGPQPQQQPLFDAAQTPLLSRVAVVESALNVGTAALEREGVPRGADGELPDFSAVALSDTHGTRLALWAELLAGTPDEPEAPDTAGPDSPPTRAANPSTAREASSTAASVSASRVAPAAAAAAACVACVLSIAACVGARAWRAHRAKAGAQPRESGAASADGDWAADWHAEKPWRRDAGASARAVGGRAVAIGVDEDRLPPIASAGPSAASASDDEQRRPL